MRIGQAALSAGLFTMAACTVIPKADAAPVRSFATSDKPVRMADERPIVQPVPRPPEAPAELVDKIRALGLAFPGRVGIAVRDVHDDWVVEYDGRSPYPQQSVSKLWVAVAMLDAIDDGEASLSDPIVIGKEDLTLFNQPIAAQVGEAGYRTTVAAMLEAAMTRSDNTANDSLLRRAGGPAAVRAKLARHGLSAIGFGPGERLLQAKTAGLTWTQDMSRGQAFQAARSKLPLARRQAALDSYLDNPPDGASAIALVDGLAKLKRGELLSPRMTDYLLGAMARSKTGPKRLKGGVPAGWGFAHKTGTGQQLGGRATGYNDIGLITAPDGRTYAIAVMIGETRRPIPERMALMQAVSRAVVASHRE